MPPSFCLAPGWANQTLSGSVRPVGRVPSFSNFPPTALNPGAYRKFTWKTDESICKEEAFLRRILQSCPLTAGIRFWWHTTPPRVGPANLSRPLRQRRRLAEGPRLEAGLLRSWAQTPPGRPSPTAHLTFGPLVLSRLLPAISFFLSPYAQRSFFRPSIDIHLPSWAWSPPLTAKLFVPSCSIYPLGLASDPPGKCLAANRPVAAPLDFSSARW